MAAIDAAAAGLIDISLDSSSDRAELGLADAIEDDNADGVADRAADMGTRLAFAGYRNTI